MCTKSQVGVFAYFVVPLRSIGTHFSFPYFLFLSFQHDYGHLMTMLKVTTMLLASREAQLSTMSATWSSVASDSPRRSAHVVEYFMVTMSRVLSSGKQFCSGQSHGLNVGRLSCFHSSYSWQPLCSLDITFTHNAEATGDDNLFLQYVQV